MTKKDAEIEEIEDGVFRMDVMFPHGTFRMPAAPRVTVYEGTLTIHGREVTFKCEVEDKPWQCECGYFNVQEKVFCAECRLSREAATCDWLPDGDDELVLVLEDGRRLRLQRHGS